MQSGRNDRYPPSAEQSHFVQDNRTLDRRSTSKHHTSQGKLTGAARTSQGTIDLASRSTPFQINSDFQQIKSANHYQLIRSPRQGGEEDDIMINNSCDEFNQGPNTQYQGKKMGLGEKGGHQIRQKNEKSLSLHDPNIDKEFLKKIQSLEISNKIQRANKQDEKQQSLRASQNLRASNQSLRMRRDLSIHSLNHQNSNKAQNDSASKQSKIPSQMMQDYETKPLKRQSSLNLKVKSRNSDWRLLNRKANVINDTKMAQQFDTDNPFKRKKNFSIYNISNHVFDPNILLQDQSKDGDGNGKVAQKRVNMTPSKKQIDEICSQIEGGNRESRPSTTRPSIPRAKNQGGQSEHQVRPQDLFESPGGNRQKTQQKALHESAMTNQAISGNQSSLPSGQVNPLDTPDQIGGTSQKQQSKKILIQTRFTNENTEKPHKLRTNRINEVINENSEFESQQNNVQEKMESPYDMGYANPAEPQSARTPAMLRDYPLLYRSNSITKIVDLQRKSFDMPYLTSRRATHHLHSFFGKQDENKEIQALKKQNVALQKQLRDQNGEFIKQKAVLEQQVHLLTQQLSIEQERCKNLKKNYTAALAAFKQKKRNSSGSSSPKQKLGRTGNINLSQSPRSSFHNSSNFSRQFAQEGLTKSFSNTINRSVNRSGSFVMNSFKLKADPWSAKKIEILQKDNKDLQMTIRRLEELIQATKEQSKSQNNLMYHKEQEIIQLRGNIIDYETKLKSNAESKIQSVVKYENKQTQRLEQEIKKLKNEQDRKITQSIEEYQARNVMLNDQIIDYQTQIKQLNNEINTHMSRLNMKEQSFRALEQQILIYETQIQTMSKEHTKVVDEYEMKISNLEKDHNQVHTVLRQLREQYEKENSASKKLPKKFSAMINSSTDNMFCQSNNITDNQQPEETIKFASSANNSTHQFETSIHQDRESNLNGQRGILTTEAFVNASTIPVDRVLSELSKSHLEIQTCIAQVHIFSKEKKQARINLNKYGQAPHTQADREIEVVIRDPEDDSMEIKDRNGVGISPIVRGQASHTLNSITDQEIISRDKRETEESMQNDFRFKQQNSTSDRKGGSRSRMEQRSPTFNEKPLKLSSYWANDEQFKDDGTCSLENVNGLRRLVANLRNKRNKLLVKFNSLKHDSLKEIKRLEGKIAFLQGQLKQEKDKRVDVQLQKIEQSSALYETINEKASKINHLKLKINEIQSEKDELQSVGQNYLGAAPRLSVDHNQYQNVMKSMSKMKGRELEQPSVYQSQQLYNQKGLPKSANRSSMNKTYSTKRNSAQANVNLKSLNNINMEEIRQKFMEESGRDQGAWTQRPPSRDMATKTMQRYMTERPCLETNTNDDFNPMSNEDIHSPHILNRAADHPQNFQNFSTSMQGISFQEQIRENEMLSDDDQGQHRNHQRSKMTGYRSPIEDIQHVTMPRSPVSFIQQSHLKQSKTLTLKSLDSQQFNKQKSSTSNNKKSSKPPHGLQKKHHGLQLESNNHQLVGGRPLQHISGYKSPENMKSPNSYFENEPSFAFNNKQMHNDTRHITNDYENNAFDGSSVNMMSPPAAIRMTRNQNDLTSDNQLRLSIKNMQQGIFPKGNNKNQIEIEPENANDLGSLDSEKDLDVGQENLGGYQSQINKPAGPVAAQQTKREVVPPLNLKFAAKVNTPNTTTNQGSQQNKGLFYAEISKNKINKLQSPQNSNYKQFLSQNSEHKNQKHPNSLLKPQIIQRPKIQSYLTQNLPMNSQTLSERKQKAPAEHFIKKTLSSKNLAARSNKSSAQFSNGPDDRVVYTAKAGIKAYKSPKNLMDSGRNSYHQNFDESPSNLLDFNNNESAGSNQKLSNYINKATSYLSSQKMTPNTISNIEPNSHSFRGFTDHKNSYSHFGGGNARAMNSFFSQPSFVSAINNSNVQGGDGPNTPVQAQHKSPYNVKTDDSQQKQKQSNRENNRSGQSNPESNHNRSRKIFATGRLSHQSNNTSYDSNASQTVKQPGQTDASRQSTAQQMYQAYKNKYLNKK